ncbi:MAG: sugar phosphate isomerase/epimerase, partial [Comamonadaceae bacterium]
MKIALCNEVLAPLPFERQCAMAAALGYDGLEVAPFTLADDPTRIDDREAARLRAVAEGHGLQITGLHWLLVAPAGLSMVSDDAALRDRTAAVMERLVDLCALLGGNYLVHGSPKQRSVPPGATREQALSRARECLTRAARRAEAAGVTYCLEPLARAETDVFNTVAEAAELVDAVGSRALKTMIDCSAAGQAEDEPVDALM